MDWIKELDFSRVSTPCFSATIDPKLPEELSTIPLLSAHSGVLDLTTKERLTEDVMGLVLSKKLADDLNVVSFEAVTLGAFVDGNVGQPKKTSAVNCQGLRKRRWSSP